MDILAELNPAQRQAAEAISRPVLIPAEIGEANTFVSLEQTKRLPRLSSRHHQDSMARNDIDDSRPVLFTFRL